MTVAVVADCPTCRSRGALCVGEATCGCVHVSCRNACQEASILAGLGLTLWDLMPGPCRHRLLGRFGRSTAMYHSYLTSLAWVGLRRIVLQEARGRCSACRRKRRRLDVHHKTYERIGNERVEDLVALCRPCHEKAHAR